MTAAGTLPAAENDGRLPVTCWGRLFSVHGTWGQRAMPRRSRPLKREIIPDPRFHNRTVAMFVNKIMTRGKKSTAERIMYDALDRLGQQTNRNPLDTFEQAIRNATPAIEVKPRRVGGATYQVPVDIRSERRMALAIRWLLRSARAR